MRTVDLARVREAEAELRALVLSGAIDTERTRAWLSGELKEGPMKAKQTTPTNLRLDADLLEQAEALAARYRERPEYRSMRWTRASVLKAAIDRGLEVLNREMDAMVEVREKLAAQEHRTKVRTKAKKASKR